MTDITPETAMQTYLSEVRQWLDELARREDVPADVARRGAELWQAFAVTVRDLPCVGKSPLDEGGV